MKVFLEIVIFELILIKILTQKFLVNLKEKSKVVKPTKLKFVQNIKKSQK